MIYEKSFDAASTNGAIAVVEDLTPEVISEIRTASTKTLSRVRKFVDENSFKQDIAACERLEQCIYSKTENFTGEAACMLDNKKFYTGSDIAKKFVWYSRSSADFSFLPSGDGRWDPLAEIFMSPAVTSILDAEREFERLFVTPFLDKSPEAKYARKLIKLAFSSVCQKMFSNELPKRFPYITFMDSLKDITMLVTQGYGAYSVMIARFDQNTTWLCNIVDAGEFIRMPVVEYQIKVSQKLSNTREEAMRGGILSIWRGNFSKKGNIIPEYVFLDIDALSLNTIIQLYEIAQLYDIKSHILISPNSWGAKYGYFQAMDMLSEIQLDNTVGIPSNKISAIRSSILNAMEYGEEHVLTEVAIC